MGHKAKNGLEYNSAAIFSWSSKKLKSGKNEIDLSTQKNSLIFVMTL